MAANPHPNAHPGAAAFRDPIELAAALTQMGPAVKARTRAITRHHAMLLRVRIQKNASGRPGPNVITSEYRASWDVKVTVAGGQVTAVVFTDSPQQRRLEYGFVGTDSNGRVFCVDMETEALTKDGWRRRDSLAVGDEILALDMDSWTSRWTPITALWDGSAPEVRVMEGASFSSVTTPDHRWAVQRYQPKARSWRREVRTAEQLTSQCRIPRAVPCSDLPTIAKHDDAVVDLAAWFWTEGSYDWGRSEGRRQHGVRPIGIRLSQSQLVNPDNCDQIRGTLHTIFGPPGPFNHGAHWNERQNRHSQSVNFNIDRVGAWILKHIIDMPDKVVRPRFFTELTEGQLRRFVDISLRADGYQPKDGRSSVVITQKIEERIRSFEVACALIGQPTVTRSRSDRDHCWPLTLLSTATANPKANAVRKDGKAHRSRFELVGEETPVWCPTTELGTWLARRRGTVYYTGNSQPPYPHIEPAFRQTQPGFLEALRTGALPR